MQIDYCDACQTRITEHDLSVGLAAWFSDRVFCRGCMDKQGLQPPPFPVQVRGRSSSSGVLKALPGSGLRRAVQPGSGIHKSSPGSGIRKAASPGSGIRKAASPGSGIRQAAKPASGIRPVSSGIRAAVPSSSGALKATSGGRIRAVRSGFYPAAVAKVRRRRTRSIHGEDGALSVLTAILTLLVAGGLFFLLRH